MAEVLGPVAALVGPTAAGKSQMAIEVADAMGNCEIVYCDSMAVYRKLDIAADKPADMRGIVHHMIDVVDPWDTFNAGDYRDQARACIASIHQRGATPIVVGGSGLWFRALVDNLTLVQTETVVRERLEKRDTSDLFEELTQVDGESAERIGVGDRRRLVRALEIIAITGNKPSARNEWSDFESVYDLSVVALTWDRKVLVERATLRVHDEIAAGLIEEVANVYGSHGISATAQQALGVKEILQFVNGSVSKEQATQILVGNTLKFLRRQLSWFRSDPRVTWVNVSELGWDAARQQIIEIYSGVSTSRG